MRRLKLGVIGGCAVCIVLWWLSYLRFESPQQWINNRLGKGDKVLWVGEHQGRYAGIVQHPGTNDLTIYITRHAFDTTSWKLDVRDGASNVDLMDFGRSIDRRKNLNGSEEAAKIPVRPDHPPEARVRLWIGDNPTLNDPALVETQIKLIDT